MKKIKKISLFLCLILSLFVLTGCGKKNVKKVSTEDSSFDSSKSGKLSCTREATAGSDVDVKLSYEVSYKKGILTSLHSLEKVTSDNSEKLTEYENAYKKIADNYYGLEYYDAVVNRSDNVVTYDTNINYEKIDMGELLDIEGSEDNVIENGVIKLDTWLKFAKKFGTKCNEVA